jgi:hypothetical protein
MPNQWGSDTVSVGAFQQRVSTAGSAVNSAGGSAAGLFGDSVRKWLALRSVLSSDSTQASETSEKPSGQLSETLSEPPSQPKILKRPDRVVGLKRWTGLILNIKDDLLTVELTPTDHEGPTFYTEFDLSLLAPDEAIAQAGDIVYLTKRFVQASSGYSTVTTQLRLRRTGQWSEKEVADITKLASRYATYFDDVE